MAEKPEDVATDTPQFGCHDLTPPAGKQQRKAHETDTAADAASQE